MLLNTNTPEVKLPVTAGMLSQSGLINFIAGNAVDGDLVAGAWHTDTSVPGAWVKADFGTPTRVRMARLYPLSGSASIWDVEYSDDNATWAKAAFGFAPSVGAAMNAIRWAAIGAHRYWRLLLTNTPGAGPYISELEFWEQPAVDVKTAYGFQVLDAPGWIDTPPRMTPAAQVLRRGGLRVMDKPREQVRQISVRGNVRGVSAQDTRDKMDALKLALSDQNGVALIFEDRLTRFVTARLESLRVPPYGPSMIQRDLSVEAVLKAYDPFSYDIDLTSFASGSIRMPLGTGPVRPIITIRGAITNPLLTLNNTAGTTTGTLQLTVVTVGGDVLIIDSDTKTIKLNGVNRLDLLTSGDFFLVDPADSQYAAPGPDLLIGGAGAATKNTSYRKSWR